MDEKTNTIFIGSHIHIDIREIVNYSLSKIEFYEKNNKTLLNISTIIIPIGAYTGHIFNPKDNYLYITTNTGQLIKINYINHFFIEGIMTIIIRPVDCGTINDTNYNPNLMPVLGPSQLEEEENCLYITANFWGMLIKINLDRIICNFAGWKIALIFLGMVIGFILIIGIYAIWNSKKKKTYHKYQRIHSINTNI
jgi:hypothetical protein